MDTVSVLMSTYGQERAENLAASLQSIFEQSVPPKQVVLVVDGPIDERQESVIGSFSNDPRVPHFDVIRTPENRGLAAALNTGLEQCVGTYVMRMDSDDLCLPDRLEVQVQYARRNPQIDVVTSWVEEFFDDLPGTRIKSSPIQHDAIVRALRWRNVLSHPTLFVRTSTLRAIGGYSEKYKLLEDYDLYLRMFLTGARFHVIPKVLVRMRTNSAQNRRRGGWSYFLNDLFFRTNYLRKGVLSIGEYLITVLFYFCFRLAPHGFRRRLYTLTRA